jgi:hypothetical protein
MTAELGSARRFYGALHAADVKDLIALLHPDFQGHLTAGLARLSRRHLPWTGGDAPRLLGSAWRSSSTPEPEQFVASDDG